MHFIGPIEKGIPIPNDARRRESPILTILRSLQLGDSFVTEIKGPNVHTYAKRIGISVATKYDSPGRIRVWKVGKGARAQK